ncbi:MAG: segregation/condensation protein A [Deltaproteobacteria bacterium]|nr:segregation/condensation protein A [Deltaproteobacteria bacterium]
MPDTPDSPDSPQTQIPLEHYDPLQVNLTVFDGPLDLLLHLVRKQQVDISEIRLAELTEPYLAYVDQMRAMNLDRASEFLSIAATLVWIKSRGLLPREAVEEDEPDPETVEELLLLRLREYQRFKDAASGLIGRDLLGRDLYPRNPAEEAEETQEAVVPVVGEVTLFGLLEAFREVLTRAAKNTDLNILPDRNRIEEKLDQVLRSLFARKSLFFTEFFIEDATRGEIILTFIAVLELVRLKAVVIRQSQACSPIYCQVTEDFLTGGDDYRARILESLFGVSKKAAAAAPAQGEAHPTLFS